MKNNKRYFKTIYFPYKDENGQNIAKNVCVAFNNTTEKKLYEKINNLSTTDIKKKITIFSYNQLIETARKENRKPTKLIKLRLKDKISNNSKVLTKTIKCFPEHIKKWNKVLIDINQKKNSKDIEEIIKFLNSIIK